LAEIRDKKWLPKGCIRFIVDVKMANLPVDCHADYSINLIVFILSNNSA
jgi:hypothetical protein